MIIAYVGAFFNQVLCGVQSFFNELEFVFWL